MALEAKWTFARATESAWTSLLPAIPRPWTCLALNVHTLKFICICLIFTKYSGWRQSTVLPQVISSKDKEIAPKNRYSNKYYTLENLNGTRTTCIACLLNLNVPRLIYQLDVVFSSKVPYFEKLAIPESRWIFVKYLLCWESCFVQNKCKINSLLI